MQQEAQPCQHELVHIVATSCFNGHIQVRLTPASYTALLATIASQDGAYVWASFAVTLSCSMTFFVAINVTQYRHRTLKLDGSVHCVWSYRDGTCDQS